jgi:carbon-monoxide dehydrogenase large subunit
MTERANWIGRNMPRREAKRLSEGRGCYTDDFEVADVGHIAFLRSPYPHARIRSIEIAAARASPGAVAVVTGDDLAAICKSWQTQLAGMPQHSSPPRIRSLAMKPAGRARPWLPSWPRRGHRPRMRLN